MVAAFTGYFASQRVGFASVLILLGLGVVLMLFVKEERAVAVAEDADLPDGNADLEVDQSALPGNG